MAAISSVWGIQMHTFLNPLFHGILTDQKFICCLTVKYSEMCIRDSLIVVHYSPEFFLTRICIGGINYLNEAYQNFWVR